MKIFKQFVNIENITSISNNKTYNEFVVEQSHSFLLEVTLLKDILNNWRDEVSSNRDMLRITSRDYVSSL